MQKIIGKISLFSSVPADLPGGSSLCKITWGLSMCFSLFLVCIMRIKYPSIPCPFLTYCFLLDLTEVLECV